MQHNRISRKNNTICNFLAVNVTWRVPSMDLGRKFSSTWGHKRVLSDLCGFPHVLLFHDPWTSQTAENKKSAICLTNLFLFVGATNDWNQWRETICKERQLPKIIDSVEPSLDTQTCYIPCRLFAIICSHILIQGSYLGAWRDDPLTFINGPYTHIL